MEKAHIRWKDGEAYDDWDNISECLYKNIVCSSLIGKTMSDNLMAEYNFQYENYSLLNFIEVCDASSDKKLIFIAFVSNVSLFDSIKTAEVDQDNKVVGYRELKYENLNFVFVRKSKDKEEILDEIEILL